MNSDGGFRRDAHPDEAHLADQVELYAIDALDAGEAATFEAALRRLPAERRAYFVAEIAETREVVARMAAGESVAPGELTRRRVFAVIDAYEQEAVPAADPDVSPSGAVRSVATSAGAPTSLDARRRRSRRLLAVAGSIAAAVALVFGGVVIGRSTTDQGTTQVAQSASEQRMQQILAEPDGTVTRSAITGAQGTVMVASSRKLNAAAIMLASAAPPTDHTYQLWLLPAQGSPRSAGMVTGAAGGSAMMVDDLGDARQVGMTVEPRGGSRLPTTEVIASVDL
ncbi:anti-sigma factor [Williamsia sterculiae]|uniref:Regulator of SigK n=1 Tax=Williamsia sterculiae TaxID=1344003 RepID=A0A1N7HCK8_9NOCA|nr:anti-sigma factor [Williamsia sterculiae]SIS22503.1 Anti-sigma-K factor RskA [Williamsia sterculiae]